MKYEICMDLSIDTEDTDSGRMFRIRATTKIPGVCEIGDLGGYISTEENLSREGNAWVSGNAQVSGDAQISDNARMLYISKVGSANGTLTAFLDKNRKIIVIRGCFIGTLAEFEQAVKKTHKNSKTAREYALLIKFIRLRLKQPAE